MKICPDCEGRGYIEFRGVTPILEKCPCNTIYKETIKQKTVKNKNKRKLTKSIEREIGRELQCSTL